MQKKLLTVRINPDIFSARGKFIEIIAGSASLQLMCKFFVAMAYNFKRMYAMATG